MPEIDDEWDDSGFGPIARIKAAWRRRQADGLERERLDTEAFGEVRAKEFFGNHRVTIRANGFVKVAEWFDGLPGTIAGPGYERMLTIEFDSDIQKKTGVGRGAATLITGGLNQAGSNMRGNIYLTIVTPSKAHVLQVEPPTDSAIKRARSLAAVGNAVLANLAAAPPIAPDGLRARLEELDVLRDSGLVSDEEYQALRQKALSEL